jgi:hypothetical protein
VNGYDIVLDCDRADILGIESVTADPVAAGSVVSDRATAQHTIDAADARADSDMQR